MARKRRGRGKPNLSGGLILAAIVLGLLASIPTQAWMVLIGVAIIGFGVWLIVRFSDKPSVVAFPPSKRPSSSKATRSDNAALSHDLTFSLDEVAPLQANTLTRTQKKVSAQAPASSSSSERRDSAGLFTVTLEVSERPSHRIPSAPANLAVSKARWLPQDEFIEIAGEKISGGMIYVGEDRNSRYGSSEPSLINPKLKVARGIVDIAERLTSYWSSYDSISPEARRA
ncbi:TerB N-terminal domain-containing protein, partial [Pseudomonas aeruginosa]